MTVEDTDGRAPKLRDGVFEATPVAHVVIDDESTVAMANAAARDELGLERDDVGRSPADPELGHRLGDLREHLDVVRRERRALTLDAVRWRDESGGERVMRISLSPLDSDGVAGVCITYLDVTAEQRLREELRSTVEELEATNQELETMNDELRTRTLELNEVNAFLETILGSGALALAVVDDDQAVQIWSHGAQDLWGLVPEEVQGRHLLSLHIGLPVEELRQPVREVLSGETSRRELALDATDRRGRTMSCVVTCLPLAMAEGQVSGAILLMDPRDGAR